MRTDLRKSTIGGYRRLKTLHFRILLKGEAPSVFYNSENEPVTLTQQGGVLRVLLSKPAERPLVVLGIVPEIENEEGDVPQIATVGAPTASELKIKVLGCGDALHLTIGKLVVD